MDARWREAGGNEWYAAAWFLDRSRQEALAMQYRVRSDEDLGRLVSAGDHRAYSELVTRYRDRVYAFALDCTRSEEEAGSVVCDAFVSAFRAAGPGVRGTPRRWFHVHTLRAVAARKGTAVANIPSQRNEP